MGKLYQFLTATAACFGSFLMGSLNVWPSYTLPLYTSPNTTVLTTSITSTESSLVGSLPSLGAMLGTLACNMVINNLGRKRGGLVFALPFLLHWLIIQFSSSSIPIMIARFIGGIAGGANLVYAPIFISEISEPSIRGTLASGSIFFYCLGVLVSYLSGWFASYTVVIWINITLCVVNAVLISIVMESPVWLLKVKREEDALRALAHYRTGSTSSKVVLEEMSVLKQQLLPPVELVAVRSDVNEKDEDAEKEKLNDENVVVTQQRESAIKKLFKNQCSRRAFIVVGTALTMQVCMGMVAVQVYAKELFSQAAPELSSDFCSVLFAMVLLAGSMGTAVIADKAGRRVLVIGSSAAVALCMGLLGILLQTSVAPPWVSAVVILIYCFCFNFGAGSVPYVLLAEVFSPEVQGLASMILVEWVWLLNFKLIAVFPHIKTLIGLHGSFYIFAVVGAGNAVLSYMNVPETKGLSNKQIQEVFLK